MMEYQNWGDIATDSVARHGSLVVGIDPVHEDIPASFKSKNDLAGQVQCLQDYAAFLIDTAAPHVGFIKPQSAFFEAFGSPGVNALAHIMAYARQKGLRIILDAKRGDISSTGAAYARAYLTPGVGSDLEADCLTVNPFLGSDTMEPFLECARKYGKGMFIQVKNSNPGAGWIQDLVVEGKTVSERIAAQIDIWSENCLGSSGLSPVGAVVGATFPQDGLRLRDLMPRSIFLLPGIGAQGGSADAINMLRRGREASVLVPISRGITKTDNLSVTVDEYRKVITERIKSFQTMLAMNAPDSKGRASC